MKVVDPYATLGVNRDATLAQIRSAHRRLVAQFHPDRNKDAGAPARFAAITKAWKILSDPGMRAQYDETGAVSVEPDLTTVMALQTISQMLSDMVDQIGDGPYQMNPVKVMADAFRKSQKKHEMALAGFEKKIKLIERAMARFKYKGDDPDGNLVHSVMRGNMTSLHQQAAKARNEIQACIVGVELVERYDFEADPPAPWAGPAMTSTFAVGAGTSSTG